MEARPPAPQKPASEQHSEPLTLLQLHSVRFKLTFTYICWMVFRSVRLIQMKNAKCSSAGIVLVDAISSYCY